MVVMSWLWLVPLGIAAGAAGLLSGAVALLRRETEALGRVAASIAQVRAAAAGSSGRTDARNTPPTRQRAADDHPSDIDTPSGRHRQITW